MRMNILQLDTPTANGHVYTEEAVKNAIDSAPDSIVGTLGYQPEPISIDKIALMANDFIIKDGWLTAKFTALKTPAGEQLQQLIDDGVKLDVEASGYGKLGEDKVIHDYRIKSLSIVVKKE